jgi:hypothetical protein
MTCYFAVGASDSERRTLRRDGLDQHRAGNDHHPRAACASAQAHPENSSSKASKRVSTHNTDAAASMETAALKMVGRDKQDLNAVAARVSDLADELVTHITDKPRPAVTFRVLNDAIDHTASVFIRYGGLLTGTEHQLISVMD